MYNTDEFSIVTALASWSIIIAALIIGHQLTKLLNTTEDKEYADTDTTKDTKSMQTYEPKDGF